MTEEQKESRRRNMARAREARRAKRAAESPPLVDEAEPEVPPILMPTLGQEGQEAPTISDDVPGEEVTLIAEPPADPFERFLAAQDAETRATFTDIELHVIFEADLKRQAAEKKTKLAAAVRERAARFNRVRLGLTSQEEDAEAEWERSMNQKVRYTPTIPRDANDRPIDVGYRVNGRIFHDGQEAVMTRGEFLSLREQEWRARNHEMDFEGKGRLSEQRRLSAGSLTAKL